MSNKLQPRLRGSAFQKEDKSWGWELVVTFGDMRIDDPRAIVLCDEKSNFLSKDTAIDNMKKASITITEDIGKAMGVKDVNEITYMDLTKGFSSKTKEEFLRK